MSATTHRTRSSCALTAGRCGRDGRDKSFFFTDLEISPTRSTSQVQLTMPLDEWKAGNFSNLKTASGTPITIYNPRTGHVDPNDPTKFVRSPFNNNAIPSDEIDRVAKNMLKYYPEPNFTPQNPYTRLESVPRRW